MVWWLFSKRSVHKKVDDLQLKIADSFKNLKNDMRGTVQWIEHLNSKTDTHHDKIKGLERRLNNIENAFYELKENLSVHGTVQPFMNVHTVEPNQAIKAENDLPDRSDLFMNVHTFMNVHAVEKLTPSERNIIALMVYSKEPLSYSEISQKLGINEVTIRRHMSDIKRMGFKMNEKVSVRSRKKLFFFEDRVKKAIVSGK